MPSGPVGRRTLLSTALVLPAAVKGGMATSTLASAIARCCAATALCEWQAALAMTTVPTRPARTLLRNAALRESESARRICSSGKPDFDIADPRFDDELCRRHVAPHSCKRQ